MKRYIGGEQQVPLTQAVQCGSMLFVSGQVPTDPAGKVTGGVGEQTAAVLKKIESLLSEAGFSLADVVKTTVYLKDAAQFAEMNRVYRQFFPRTPPARATVQANLMIDALIEIEAIAMRAP
jgi:reactive intermediate/imine deaminase